MIAGLKKGGITLLKLVLVILTAVFMPVLIWVAAVVSIRLALIESHAYRRLTSAEGMACLIDIDCPSGYYCVNGRCVPVLADQ